MPLLRNDERLVAGLRRGDVDPFAMLVDRRTSAMVRVALAYVPTKAPAEEAVHDSVDVATSAKAWTAAAR